MTKQEWCSHLKKAISKKKVEQLAESVSTSESVKELIDLTFHPQYQIAFRAAWILEYTLIYSPNALQTKLEYFLIAYEKQKNYSCQRHFSKILMFFTAKANERLLRIYPLELVVETTFKWLIDPETPVAVQVNCMDILFNLKDRFNWIEEELKEQINFLLKNGTAAMQSRGKKLLKKLR